MRRRLLAGFTALAIATLGAILIIKYVRSYEESVRADEELVSVLVVRDEVPVGADPATVRSAVEAVDVPTRLVAGDSLRSITELDALTGQVTNAALLRGEQVVARRFEVPRAVNPDGSRPVPDGLVGISLTLEPQRALGGRLAAGDHVGLYISVPQQIPGTTQSQPVIQVVAEDLLVTRVASTLTVDPNASSAAPASPSDSVTVTLAVPADLVPAITTGGELGTVWLTLVSSGSVDTTTSTTSGGDK
ncbi:Flp pilus assembly protein CpaB [Geodermatophilus sp. SYSU D01119]